MMIDKIGGIGPGYGPKKNESVSRIESSTKASDNVTISEEGARAADVSRIARMAQSVQEPERVEKLREVKEKLSRGEYDNLTDEFISKVADRITSDFLSESLR